MDQTTAHVSYNPNSQSRTSIVIIVHSIVFSSFYLNSWNATKVLTFRNDLSKLKGSAARGRWKTNWIARNMPWAIDRHRNWLSAMRNLFQHKKRKCAGQKKGNGFSFQSYSRFLSLSLRFIVFVSAHQFRRTANTSAQTPNTLAICSKWRGHTKSSGGLECVRLRTDFQRREN